MGSTDKIKYVNYRTPNNKFMKKLFFILTALFFSFTGFAQETIQGFSEQIIIGGQAYYVSDNYPFLDYRAIAKPDCFKTMFGKMPAFGLIDSNNNIVIPFNEKCSGFTYDPQKGCILVLHSNKAVTKIKVGVYDFNGKEIIPVGIKANVLDLKNPYKKVWEQYDELPAEVKEEMIEIYKQKKAAFDAKMGK